MNLYDIKRSVLLVEDDAFICRTFRKVFDGQQDFVLDVANTVYEALDKIETLTYDVIFLDMAFGADRRAGMNVLRELNKQTITMTAQGRSVLNSLVVIMSGSIPLSEVMPEANALGVLCFLDKPTPFTEDFVRRVVQRVGLPLLPPPRKIG